MAVVGTSDLSEGTWQVARLGIDYPPLGTWNAERGISYRIYPEDGRVFFEQEVGRDILKAEVMPLTPTEASRTPGCTEWVVLLDGYDFTLRLERGFLYGLSLSKGGRQTVRTMATLDSSSKRPFRMEESSGAWKRLMTEASKPDPHRASAARALEELFDTINEFNKRLKIVRYKDNSALPDIATHLTDCLTSVVAAKPKPWAFMTIAAKQLYEWEHYMPHPPSWKVWAASKEVDAIKAFLEEYNLQLKAAEPWSLQIPPEVGGIVLRHARALMEKDSQKFAIIEPAGMLSLVVSACIAGKCDFPTGSLISLPDLLNGCVISMARSMVKDDVLKVILPRVYHFLSNTPKLTLDVYEGLAQVCRIYELTRPEAISEIVEVLRKAVPQIYLIPVLWGVVRHLDQVQIAVNRNDPGLLGRVFVLARDETELCGIFRTLLSQKVERRLRFPTIADQLSQLAAQAAETTRLMEAQDILGRILLEALSTSELGSAYEVVKLLSDNGTILLRPEVKLDLYKRCLPRVRYIDTCLQPHVWGTIFQLVAQPSDRDIETLLLILVEATETIPCYRLDALRAAEGYLVNVNLEPFLDNIGSSTIPIQELRPTSKVDASLFLKLVPHLDEVPPRPESEKPFVAWLEGAISQKLRFPMAAAIDKRLTYRSGKSAYDIDLEECDWLRDWAPIQKVTWPTLQPLLRMCWPPEPRDSKVISLLLGAWAAFKNGDLPVAAYKTLPRTEVGQGKSGTGASLESPEFPSIIACVLELDQGIDRELAWSQVDDCLTTQAKKCEEKTDVLKKQLYLLDWLVENGFDGRTQQEALKKQLADLDKRPLRELEAAVASDGGVGTEDRSPGSGSGSGWRSGRSRSGLFSGLVGIADEQVRAFMQHCVLQGSDLLRPVLQLLMDDERATKGQELSSKRNYTLNAQSLGRSFAKCYVLFQRFVGLPARPDGSQNNWGRVRDLLIKELAQSPATLKRRLDILFEFEEFSNAPTARKEEIESACLFETFQSKLQVIVGVLQQFKWDWAVRSDEFQELSNSVTNATVGGQPEIERAAELMKAFQKQLSITPAFDFSIFDKLREHEAVFEFFAKRKALFEKEGGLVNGFRERLKIVRNSLQEEARDRQKLLHELEACFDILLPFLEQDKDPWLVSALTWLGRAFKNFEKFQSRIKSFDTVSKQLELFKALFDSKGNGRFGVAQLVFTVRDMMRGSFYINPFDGNYCCKYQGLTGRKEVTISQVGLQDYIMRCNMEMVEPDAELVEHDPQRQEQMRKDRETMGDFLRQVEALLGTDSGLLLTSQQFCKEGHPEFRSREVSFSLMTDLRILSTRQSERLQLWGQHLRDAFMQAELLELLPRAQIFHWMVTMAEAFAQLQDAWELLREEMGEAVSLWCSETPIWAVSRGEHDTGFLRDFANPFQDRVQGVAGNDQFTRWLTILVGAFQGLVPDLGVGATARGRFIVNAEAASPSEILQFIAEQFLKSPSGARLPRYAEVLFCEATTDDLAVEAFLRRCERFSELTFVLVEPNVLPPESKERVARWLNASRTGNVIVILTAYWPLTFAPVERQPLTLTLNGPAITRRWLEHCPVREISIYPAERTVCSAQEAEALHVTSGKSTAIHQICEEMGERLLSVIVDESFSVQRLVAEIKGSYENVEGVGVLPITHLHLDLTPYSDHHQVNVLLRNLLVCGTLLDPKSGLVAPLHAGLHLHIELGSLVRDQDPYSLRKYATTEMVAARFPKVRMDQLHLGLLYPLVGLLGDPERGLGVVDSPLHLLPRHFPRPLIDAQRAAGEGRGGAGDCTAAELTLKVMHASVTPQPFADDGSWLLDMRSDDFATFTMLGQEEGGEQGFAGAEGNRVLARMAMPQEEIQRLIQDGAVRIPTALLPMPDNPYETLATFVEIKCGLRIDNNSKAQQAVMVKAFSAFAEWTSLSRLMQDGSVRRDIRSLLLSAACCCLRQPNYSEELGGMPGGMDEACLYFVPGFWGEDKGDFRVYVPTLVDGHCRLGAHCPCNSVRDSLRDCVPEQVLVMDANDLVGLSLQDQAAASAEQSSQALACALGLTPAQVVDILEHDEYILSRDFTCKFLELDWRRKARVPVIIEGESGTGKSRLLKTYVRLLMESGEARPPLLRGLYDQMRTNLLMRKDDLESEALGEVEAVMNQVLPNGFSTESFLELLQQRGLWSEVLTQVGDLEPIFTPELLIQDLLDSVQGSPRYDIALLNFMLAPLGGQGEHAGEGEEDEGEGEEVDDDDDDDVEPRGLVGEEAIAVQVRQQARFRTLSPQMQERHRNQARGTLGLGSGRLQRGPQVQGEQAVLFELVRAVADLPPEPIYFPVQLHADVSPEELFELVEPAREACRRDRDTTVLLFLDEANTSSCLGVIKSMMCDDWLTKEHPNLFIVAAVNPYRPEVPEQKQKQKSKVARDFFQVHPFPESFRDYIWHWRLSDDDDERDYITERFRRFKSEAASFEDVDRFITTLVTAQKLMRAMLGSKSAVSQRDIMRFFTFLRFFVAHLTERELASKRAATKDPMARIEITPGEKRFLTGKSCLLSLSLVYYLGLTSEERALFEEQVSRPLCRNLGSVMQINSLSATLTAEMDHYFEHITLPAAVAPTRALKENMFAVIVCIHCSVPVMIVGMPGTGKTLAVNLVTTDVLKGDRAEPFFRNFAYVSESVIRYQCSKESSSKQIHEVFERAAAEQRIFDRNGQAKKAMVFVDEAGLPDEKVESLKAIHYHFDCGVIPACLLANQPLDAAKRNRAVQVFREASDPQDLRRIAKEALRISDQDTTHNRFADGLCRAFQFVTNVPGSDESSKYRRPMSFNRFHLRDFTYLLRDLRVNGYNTNVKVLRALERNFGGISEADFTILVDVFFEQLEQETMKRPEPKDFRGVLEVIKEALLDKPTDEDIQAKDFQPRRYMMIVDETDDGSALRALQEMGAMDSDLEVNEVSDLPGDTSQLHQSVVVSHIRSAAAKEGVHVLTNFESALDGFYDLLNLRFLQLTDATGCCGFMATVAFGNYSRLAHVHPRFKLVVMVRASELPGLPLPLLNRFEKYRIGPLSWALERAQRLTGHLAKPDFLRDHVLGAAAQSVETLVASLGKSSLIGYQYRMSLIASTTAATTATQPQSEAETTHEAGVLGPTVCSLLAEALQYQQEKLEEWSLLLSACSSSMDRLVKQRPKFRPPSRRGGASLDYAQAAARRELLSQASLDFPVDLDSKGSSMNSIRRSQTELWSHHYLQEEFTCMGHENVGNTCYLQVALVLVAIHGTYLCDPDMPVQDPKNRDLSIAANDLKAVIEASKKKAVKRSRMALLEESLVDLKVVEKGQQLDAVETLEQLLHAFGGRRLNWRSVWCLPAEERQRLFDKFGRGNAAKQHLEADSGPKPHMMRVSLTSDASTDLQALLNRERAEVLEQYSFGEGSDKIEVRGAARVRQRLEGELPPGLLPICLQRYLQDGSSARKNEAVVKAPMKGLLVPMLSPYSEPFEDGVVEVWNYDLRSFILHTGTSSSGHYIAYWHKDNQWHCANNDSVSRVSQEEAQREADRAYLLVYELTGWTPGGPLQDQGAEPLPGSSLENSPLEPPEEETHEEQVQTQTQTTNAEGQGDGERDWSEEEERWRVLLSEIVVGLVMHVVRRLLQLAPSETIVAHRQLLPQDLKDHFATQQPHVGLGGVVAKLKSGSVRKCVLYTRNVLAQHEVVEGDWQRRDANIIFMPKNRLDMVGRLREHKQRFKRDAKPLIIMCRVSEHFKLPQQSARGTEHVFSQRAVNSLRRCIDGMGLSGVAVVLLLQPQWYHTRPCYGAVFAGEWDFYHLDTLSDGDAPFLVPTVLFDREIGYEGLQNDDVNESDMQSFDEDLWSAVAQLRPAHTVPKEIRTWTHPAAIFYSADAGLFARREALMGFLDEPGREILKFRLRYCYGLALQGRSLVAQTEEAARSIMGTGAGAAPSLQSLQATVRAASSTRLSSILAAGLFGLADQGGFRALSELGESGEEAAACFVDVQMRRAAASSEAPQLPRFIAPLVGPSHELFPRFFSSVFDGLQTLLLQSANSEEDVPFDTQHKQGWQDGLVEVRVAISRSRHLLKKYCGFALWRLGLAHGLDEVMANWVGRFQDEAKLPVLHWVCWRRRSDLAALGMLLDQNIPIDTTKYQPSEEDLRQGKALSQDLVTSVLRDLRESLLGALQGDRDHDDWLKSFETIAAVIDSDGGGDLLVEDEAGADYIWMRFVATLLPSVKTDSLDVNVLVNIALETDPQHSPGSLPSSLEMRRLTFRSLADLARARPPRANSGDTWPYVRVAQRLLEEMMSVSQTRGLTPEEGDFALEVIADDGLFGQCPGFISLAFGSTVLQRLLQASNTNNERFWRLCRDLNRRMEGFGVPSVPFWPLKAGPQGTLPWPPTANSATFAGVAPWQSQIAHFLFHAMHGQPELAEITGSNDIQGILDGLGEGVRDSRAFQNGAFDCIRGSARILVWIDRAADFLSTARPESFPRGAVRAVQEIFRLLRAHEDGEDTPPEFMSFFVALTKHTGSTVRAAAVLQDLSNAHLEGGPAQVQRWVGVLQRPEQANAGAGEDPWHDFPTSSLPGFEADDVRRRRIQAQEEEASLASVAGEARECPFCGQPVLKNRGCNHMVCGRNWSARGARAEGCGQEFNWDEDPSEPHKRVAVPYRPRTRQAAQGPAPGFTAVRRWISSSEDFTSPAAIQAAEASLHDLAAADRRFVVANACACLYLKAGQEKASLANALLAEESTQLRTALGFPDTSEGRKLARVVAAFSAPTVLGLDRSGTLAAEALLGQNSATFEVTGEDPQTFAKQLQHSLVNLLVAIVGSEGNNHLTMALCNPIEMHNTCPVGFIYGLMPGNVGWHFDCGCVLQTDGQPWATERTHMSFATDHWHFVIFCTWGALSTGYLLFDDHTPNSIYRILSQGHVERGGFKNSNRDARESDMASSFAMNFSKEAFHFILRSTQGISGEDRGLCLSQIFLNLRSLPADQGGRTFKTIEQRRVYESLWIGWINAARAGLEQLQAAAMGRSDAQQGLKKLYDFRAGLSHMLRFFPDFAQVCLTIPPDTRFSFIRKIAEVRGELSTLSLLGDIVRVQKWINDTLNGKVTEDDLKKPLVSFLQERAEADWKKGRMSDHLRCQDLAEVVFPELVSNWQRFHEEHNGRIPIECQAGREEMLAAQGQEVDENAREAIEPIEGEGHRVPLQFFLDLHGQKSDARLVAEYLARQANDVVKSACDAASDTDTMSAWAEHMNQAVPVWLCDVLLQGRFQELASAEALRSRVLGALRGMEAGGSPIVDWAGVQQDLLIRHANRLRQMEFPNPPPFNLLVDNSSTSNGVAVALAPELQQQVKKEAMGLRSHELKACQQLATYTTKLAASCTAQDDVLNKPLTEALRDHQEYKQVSQVADEVFRGITLAQAEGAKALLDGFYSEFADISHLLKAELPAHIDLVKIFQDACKLEAISSTTDIADLDATTCEAITDLQGTDFVRHLELGAADEALRTTYDVIFCGTNFPIDALPEEIHGKHLEAVLEALRQFLRLVRLRKGQLVKNLTWSPHATELQRINITDAQVAAEEALPADETANLQSDQTEGQHSAAEAAGSGATATATAGETSPTDEDREREASGKEDGKLQPPQASSLLSLLQAAVQQNGHVSGARLKEVADREPYLEACLARHQIRYDPKEAELVSLPIDLLGGLVDACSVHQRERRQGRSKQSQEPQADAANSSDQRKQPLKEEEDANNNSNNNSNGSRVEAEKEEDSESSEPKWMASLKGFTAKRLWSLMDSEAAQSCMDDLLAAMLRSQRKLTDSGGGVDEVRQDLPQGLPESLELQQIWRRYLGVLGTSACKELEDALLQCVGREALDIFETPLRLQSQEVKRMNILSWDGCYFEVHPKEVVEPVEQDAKSGRMHESAAILVQWAWRRHRQRSRAAEDQSQQALTGTAAGSSSDASVMSGRSTKEDPRQASSTQAPTEASPGMSSPSSISTRSPLSQEKPPPESTAPAASSLSPVTQVTVPNGATSQGYPSAAPAPPARRPQQAPPARRPLPGALAPPHVPTNPGAPGAPAAPSALAPDPPAASSAAAPSAAAGASTSTSAPTSGPVPKEIPDTLLEWLQYLDLKGGLEDVFVKCLLVLEREGYDTLEKVWKASDEAIMEALGPDEKQRLKPKPVKMFLKDLERLRNHFRDLDRSRNPVGAWLTSIGLGAHEEAFRDYGFETLELLADAEEDDFKGEGCIPLSEGELETFWHHLAQLRAG